MDKDFSYINELMDSPARLSNAGKNETTTPHHQGGTEKQDDGKHNRSVSWDHAEDEERDGDGPEIPPHLMPPKPKPKISNWKKLTAKNIIEMTPTEDRAETYLQKQLEAKAAASNEEQEELDRVGDALSGIREEHLNEFAAKGSSAKKGPRSVASSTFSKTRNLKGGDKLFGLVSQLTGGYTAEGLKKSSGTIIDYDGDDEDVPEEQDMPTTHTDALVNNAAQIFLRKGKATKKATTTETTTTYEPVDDTKPDKKPSIVAMEEGKMKKNIIRKQADKVKDTMSGDFHDFVDFVKEGKSKIWARVRNALIFLILPSIGAAFLCFYALDNPPCGTAEECQEKGKAIPRYDSNGTLIEIEYFDDPNNQASVSWWFLFIGVRLVITLGVSLLFQAVLVDFCCLTTSMCTRLFGSFITLFIVQSKGLPFLVFTWYVQ